MRLIWLALSTNRLLATLMEAGRRGASSLEAHADYARWRIARYWSGPTFLFAVASLDYGFLPGQDQVLWNASFPPFSPLISLAIPP